MRTKFLNARAREQIKKGCIALICSMSAFFLFLAYCLKDFTKCPWFFVSNQESVAPHWFVYYGSCIVGFLTFFIGSAGILFVPLLLFIAYNVFYSSLRKEIDRFVAFGVLILSCSIIGGWYSYKLMTMPFRCGGIFGQSITLYMKSHCQQTIVSIFLTLILCTALLCLFRMSYVTLFGHLYSLPWSRWFNAVQTVSAVVVRKIVFTIKSAGIYLLETLHPQAFKQAGDSIIQQELQELLYNAITQSGPEKKVTVTPVRLQEITKPTSEIGASENQEQEYTLPPYALLAEQTTVRPHDTKEQTITAGLLEEKLERFGIKGTVVGIKKGPVITLFEYKPTIDTKISKILALEDDLALALQALTIRIIAPIPGTDVVGFEVANKTRQPVLFSMILHTAASQVASAHLPLIVGVDTVGNPIVVDLVSLPHMLVAGSTGSGKSVALNVFLSGLLYHCSPDRLKCILIDPKRLEFAAYHDIPHLLFPIVTEVRDAGAILKWVVQTMECRYKTLATLGVKNIADYHALCVRDKTLEPMPYIVVMIDELSDLMMVVGKHVEECIIRIAQMARAAGIHMIIATQRPSVDVITGIIKVNFPSRVSFKVSSKIDSRTILDEGGAEKLLGKGDMLYKESTGGIRRAHGAFIADHEIATITQYIRAQRTVTYLNIQEELAHPYEQISDDTDHELYQQIVQFLSSIDEVSISLLQRKFKIGYNRAARIMERLEAEGLIMASHGGKTRKVIRRS